MIKDHLSLVIYFYGTLLLIDDCKWNDDEIMRPGLTKYNNASCNDSGDTKESDSFIAFSSTQYPNLLYIYIYIYIYILYKN